MASIPEHQLYIEEQSSNDAEDIESEPEDEVDQLESDTDTEEPEVSTSGVQGSSPSASERTPGHSLLPAVRLENILQADGVTGNLALSKEGLFILSVATEEFIKRMAQNGYLHAASQRRTSIAYKDMACVTKQYQELLFLNDTIPEPISLSTALRLREAKEKEMLEEDPAMATSDSLNLPSNVSPLTTRPLKSKKSKPRASSADKRDAASGEHVYVGNRRKSKQAPEPPHELPPTDRRREDPSLPREGHPFTEWHPLDEPLHPIMNGHTSPARSTILPPAPVQQDVPEHHSPPHNHAFTRPQNYVPLEESWSGPFTGPASGFLQGPGGPFGSMAQNPGRTIYSQQFRPAS